MRKPASFSLAKQADGTRFGLTPVQRGRAATIAAVGVMMLAATSSAHASPFDTMLNNFLTLFSGPVARTGALVGTVMGGWGWMSGDPGAKRNAIGIATGICIMVLAASIIAWVTTG